MVFCTKCGTQLADDANFCGKCGTATGAAAQGNAAGSTTRVDNDPWGDGTIRIDDAPSSHSTVKACGSIKDVVARIATEKKPLDKHFVFMVRPEAEKEKMEAAHALADQFKAAGLLPTNNVIETDRGNMVGMFIGQTAVRVKEQCNKAMGGILFIDDAYSLSQGQDDIFGREAVDTLLKQMEDNRGKFVVIISGYTEKMEAFLQSVPGLKSRFSEIFNFDE